MLAIGFRHKRAFVLCFCGILAGSILAIFLVPPTYESVSQILVMRERVDPVVSAEKNDPLQIKGEVTEEEMNSEAELINSDDVLRKTVVASGLDQAPSLFSFLSSGPDPDQRISKAIDKLHGDLKIEPLKKTDVIRLTYSAHNPRLASRVLNNLVNAYIDKHVSIHRPAGQMEFFEQETNRYKKDLDNAETQLKKFSEQQGGVAPQISRDITLQKLNDFSASLETTRAEMAATEKKINSLEQQAGATPDRLTTAVRETDDGAVLQQLKSTLLDPGNQAHRTAHQVSADLPPGAGGRQGDCRHPRLDRSPKKPSRCAIPTTDRNPTYAWINEELAKAKADYSAQQARASATQAIVGVYQSKAHQLEEQRPGSAGPAARSQGQRRQLSAVPAQARGSPHRRSARSYPHSERGHDRTAHHSGCARALGLGFRPGRVAPGRNREHRPGIHARVSRYFLPHSLRCSLRAEYSGLGRGSFPAALRMATTSATEMATDWRQISRPGRRRDPVLGDEPQGSDYQA